MSVIEQKTGLKGLLTYLPIKPDDYDINEGGDVGMSWYFPGPHFIQLEIPYGKQSATWIIWHLSELHKDTIERYLDLGDPLTWKQFIHTFHKMIRLTKKEIQ